MKARVKATGEIIEISEDCSYLYAEHYDKSYNLNQLEFLDVKEKSFPKDTLDYWTRLEHQYAGMAMQAMLTSPELMQVVTGAEKLLTKGYAEKVAIIADKYAHALVEKMKNQSV